MERLKIINLSVYVIIDPVCCAGRAVIDIARMAISGGATMIQYRNKSADYDVIRRDVLALRDATIESNVPLLVNDYVEIAAEYSADGVHIGQGDISAKQARDIMGADAIVGVTAYTKNHIAAIDSGIVDYIGTGPFYETKTDKGKPILGVQKFPELVALSPVPVVGIGGITPENANPVIAAGANGVAMMRSVTESQDVEAATRAFVEVTKR